MKDSKIKIKLIKSSIGRLPKHRLTLESLGLKKIGQIIEVTKNSSMVGKLKQIGYMLEITE